MTPEERKRKRQKEASARWRERHPDRHELALLRMNARKKGLEPSLVEDYWRTHTGLCDICGKPERGQKKRLSIEHDHITGEFRGLVCGRCNTMLGMANDDDTIFLAAISYLKRSRL